MLVRASSTHYFIEEASVMVVILWWSSVVTLAYRWGAHCVGQLAKWSRLTCVGLTDEELRCCVEEVLRAL